MSNEAINKNGLKIRSLPVEIKNPLFLISIRDEWFIFNADGVCFSISNYEKIFLPNMRAPILDISTINRSIAILTKEQILVLNVR